MRYGDVIEECCVETGLTIETFFHLAVLNARKEATNRREIELGHLRMYRSPNGGIQSMPDYIIRYAEKTMEVVRASREPVHA